MVKYFVTFVKFSVISVISGVSGNSGESTWPFFEVVSFFTDSYSKFTADFKSTWYRLSNVKHFEKIDQIQNGRSELWVKNWFLAKSMIHASFESFFWLMSLKYNNHTLKISMNRQMYP